MPYEFDQIPYPLVYEEQAAFKDTYGGAEGVVVCESYLLKPKVESDTVLVFMHPVGGGAYLPMVRHLAAPAITSSTATAATDPTSRSSWRRSCSTSACACAMRRSGSATRRSCSRGGVAAACLSLYYQEQAEKPWVTATPAGDPPDLTAASLVPVDAVMLLAAHTSRHGVLDAEPRPVDRRRERSRSARSRARSLRSERAHAAL